MKSEKIRVQVVDDHPLMREALRAAIEDETDLEIVGEASDGITAVRQFQTLQPDVVVMDLFMPGQSGIEATRAILQQAPDAHILALTSASEPDVLSASIQAGALGYLTKDSSRQEILHAVREVSQGNAFFSPLVASKLRTLMQGPSAAHAGELPGESLTDRESDVLKLIGEGCSNKQIAERLHLSASTVRTHIQHVLDKLGLENRNQAILYVTGQHASPFQATRVG